MRWQFLSHRIAFSKVLTNTFSGEPPSKRLVLVLCALLRHSWAPSFGAPLPIIRTQGTQSLFPVVVRRTYRQVVVRLRRGPDLRKPSDRPVLTAALCSFDVLSI